MKLSELFWAVNTMLYTLSDFCEPVYTRSGDLVLLMPALVKLRLWRDTIYLRDTLICGNGGKVADYNVEIYDDCRSPVFTLQVALTGEELAKAMLKAADTLPSRDEMPEGGLHHPPVFPDRTAHVRPVEWAGITGGGHSLEDELKAGVVSEHEGEGGRLTDHSAVDNSVLLIFGTMDTDPMAVGFFLDGLVGDGKLGADFYRESLAGYIKRRGLKGGLLTEQLERRLSKLSKAAETATA